MNDAEVPAALVLEEHAPGVQPREGTSSTTRTATRVSTARSAAAELLAEIAQRDPLDVVHADG